MSAPSTLRALQRRSRPLATLAALVAIAVPATALAAHGPAMPGKRSASGLASAPFTGGAVAPPATSASRAPADARSVQQRLVALRYLPADAVTGRWDYRTTQALMAFQAWQGLDRDGVAGPQTRETLRTAAPPKPVTATRGRSIEVFRAKGVTLLIEGSQVVRAVHSSSGKPGYTTPAGTYRVFRKEASSWSYPYHTWLPYASYFNAGIAFHGYPNVPAQPASHGCIRISAPEAPFVYAFATIGTTVTVF
jgi:lipoprotein-anchoring transpeptidase ErfK/SrfK